MLNMVGRVRFAIAQPTTIAGFFLASFLLIALVSVASTDTFRLTDLPPGASRSLTQAYYFACWAAGMYFIIAGLMVFTVYGALAGRYEKKFDITTSQRTLMMQTISLMGYLLIGAAVYTALEGWQFNDAVYWADFTLLTIGIGDNFVPISHAGRALVLPYTFGGILAVGLVISSIRSMLLEKGAKKLHARTVEKKRSRVHSIEDAEWGSSSIFRFLNRKNRNREPRTYDTERDRRYAEFCAMRRIHERTAAVNRYRSLAVSTLNAAILWFVGALVFYKTEEHLQGWSYFQALYFAWVSLITLGYGDFQPVSNAGKAFFVLWSLLAIPTLTVLISDMSDTVVKGISDLTNYLGSLTIVPGDADFFQKLRKNLNMISGGFLFKQFGPEVRKLERKEREEAERGRVGNLPTILDRRMTADEKKALDEYCKTSKESARSTDTHFYHFVLIKEIRSVLVDTAAQPPKKYTYDEWAYYLKLLGHEEEDPSFHTRKLNAPRKDDEDGPQVARILDHDSNPRDWSWLSLRSPLLGLGSESDWILQRLLAKLQGELHFQGKPGRGIGDHPPPFSIMGIRGHASGVDAGGLNGAELKKLESTFA